MANNVLINGKKSDLVSFRDRGLQYGDGVFESIAIENGQLLCWDEHLNRMEQGCKQLNISQPDKIVLKEETASLLQSINRSVIKIIITRGLGGRGYSYTDSSSPNRIISIHDWPEHPRENSTQGIATKVCDYRYAKNIHLAGIKHLNRLEQIVARSEWHDNSIVEGIVMDQYDHIIEGTMSNIFCLIDDVLCTPDLTECGVKGVVRRKILETASEININTEIKKISLSMLKSATEIFMCNSIIGIWPVRAINEQTFSVGKKTLELQQYLLQNKVIASSC
ncbi:MAG: aminodeoxychorismate lyase [Pseudomonadota bacterium]